EVFRGKFVDALQHAFRDGQLCFHRDLTLLAQPKTFAAWLRPLYRKDWIVYLKPPFGGPQFVLQYLGRYTHRVAISNYRLVSFADGKVTFRRRDSAHNNEQKLMSLSLDEFLRRFLLHLLPKGFVRIRHFGFLANRRRSTLLPLGFAALGSIPLQTQPKASLDNPSLHLRPCPCCGGRMIFNFSSVSAFANSISGEFLPVRPLLQPVLGAFRHSARRSKEEYDPVCKA